MPVSTFFDQDIWALCKRYPVTLNGKRINYVYRIFEYASIGELLFDFLHDNHWFCTLSSNTKTRLEEDINYVYFFENEYSSRFTYKQRFKLIQQFIRREIGGAKIIPAPILKELSKVVFDPNAPLPQSYPQAIEMAEKAKFKLPENDILEFIRDQH